MQQKQQWAVLFTSMTCCCATQANDFGGEIIPWAANDGYKVQAYLFNDYWEDIGTIKSFFEANLALAAQVAMHSDGRCRTFV